MRTYQIMKFSSRFLAFAALCLAGCAPRSDGGRPARKVVVYSALDSEFSKPMLDLFQKRTGVRVDAKFDVESTKTVGLTRTIVLEANRPRCDLFWNNEILNTLRLKRQGMLAPMSIVSAEDYPTIFRASDKTWYGFAARARILLVNTNLVGKDAMPKGIDDLVNPRWKGKIAIAKPLFGTTATHAACLFATWGEGKAKAYFDMLKANKVQVLSGNRQVAQAVGTGAVALGLTDTDDAMEEIAAGSRVAIVYPDRGPRELGTLFIPNTLAAIKGAPHPEEARMLAEFLLSPEVEAALATGPSAQIPLNPKVKAATRVETPATVHAMEVDFEKAASMWDLVAAFLADRFGGE